MQDKEPTHFKQSEGRRNPKMIITLVGEAEVGKTQILRRFIKNAFSKDYKATIGMDYLDKEITLEDGNTIELRCWDTGGQERFFPTIPKEVTSAHGAVAIVLDGRWPTEELHLSMTYWVDWAQETIPNATIYFMVNKTDEDGCREALALWDDISRWNSNRKKSDPNHQDIWAFYCSAKEDSATVEEYLISCRNKGISKIFEYIAKACYAKRLDTEEASESIPFWEKFKNTASKHKIWFGGNIFIIVALITLLVMVSLTVGGVFAFAPLSAFAVAGIITSGITLLWNGGYAIFNAARGGGTPPSTASDGDETPFAKVQPSVFSTTSTKSDASYTPVYSPPPGKQASQTMSSPSQTSSNASKLGSGDEK